MSAAVIDAFMAPELWTCPFITHLHNEEGVIHRGEHPIVLNSPCKGLLCPLWRDLKSSRPGDQNLGFCGAGGRP